MMLKEALGIGELSSYQRYLNLQSQYHRTGRGTIVKAGSEGTKAKSTNVGQTTIEGAVTKANTMADKQNKVCCSPCAVYISELRNGDRYVCMYVCTCMCVCACAYVRYVHTCKYTWSVTICPRRVSTVLHVFCYMDDVVLRFKVLLGTPSFCKKVGLDLV